MLRFISFGSGSSGNCYCLFTDGDAMLIDAGLGIRTLKKDFINYGLSLASIHHIIITHDHADHISSVGSLSTKFHLPVYTTAKVHEGIFRNWHVKQKIESKNIRYIEKNQTSQIGEFAVTPFNVPHDSTDNVGYMIEAEGVVFTLITDCGHITDEMKPIIHKTNYLVIEANHDLQMLDNGPYPVFLRNRIKSENGHLSNDSCGEALAECLSPELRHVWLCHLSEKNNTPDNALRTVSGILKAKGIKVGGELKVDVLNRKQPTGIFELT